jgi:hypothetical protein
MTLYCPNRLLGFLPDAFGASAFWAEVFWLFWVPRTSGLWLSGQEPLACLSGHLFSLLFSFSSQSSGRICCFSNTEALTGAVSFLFKLRFQMCFISSIYHLLMGMQCFYLASTISWFWNNLVLYKLAWLLISPFLWGDSANRGQVPLYSNLCCCL